MNNVLSWLLTGDVSIQYQTHRDLLHSEGMLLEHLQQRIETEGFGSQLLSARNASGHWGLWYYQPKWTSTHYTLCDLKALGLAPSNPVAAEMVDRALCECQLADGGVNFAKSNMQSDIAVNGMFLDYASYFCPQDTRLSSLVSCILTHQKCDGGFSWDNDSLTSDPHTTQCVLEGLYSYQLSTQDAQSCGIIIDAALQWLYERNLCIGEDPRYIRLAYPYRYRYDLLRFLEFAAKATIPWNENIEKVLAWLLNKQHDGVWNLELTHPGKVHVQFERLRQPSRVITLKALNILNHYASDSKTAAQAWNTFSRESVPVLSIEGTGT